MGEGSGRESGHRFAESGRVQEKWLCGCPPHAIGKQSSMPLINLGHKHAIQIQA